MNEELYQQALDFLKTINELDDAYPAASTFQRRFRIGSSEAARIVERMEIEGFISEFNGREPREVLKTL